jgi:hypothetical protein
MSLRNELLELKKKHDIKQSENMNQDTLDYLKNHFIDHLKTVAETGSTELYLQSSLQCYDGNNYKYYHLDLVFIEKYIK